MEECGLAVEGGENEVGGVGHVAGDDGADADDNEK